MLLTVLGLEKKRNENDESKAQLLSYLRMYNRQFTWNRRSMIGDWRKLKRDRDVEVKLNAGGERMRRMRIRKGMKVFAPISMPFFMYKVNLKQFLATKKGNINK